MLNQENKLIKIAFVVQLPNGVSPSQRFRCENWNNYLESQGFTVHYYSFVDAKTYTILYGPGNNLQKFVGTLKGFINRFGLLFKLKPYKFIYLQREATPIGPPLFEWVITKVLRKKVIYDFDDAIWIAPHKNKLYSLLKCCWKVKFVCKWSHSVAVGNAYLQAYAKQYNSNTILLPTVVDTILQHNKQKKHEQKQTVVIGWTGSHSTLPYLRIVSSALQTLSKNVHFQFLLIADRLPDFELPNLRFMQWNSITEIEDLLQMDIGIMPLPNDNWSEGKCGFKLIQYLALGIPAIASPVGINKEIVKPDENGYLCNSDNEWVSALLLLVNDFEKRTHFGNAGRRHVQSNYSIVSQKKTFFSLFT